MHRTCPRRKARRKKSPAPSSTPWTIGRSVDIAGPFPDFTHSVFRRILAVWLLAFASVSCAWAQLPEQLKSQRAITSLSHQFVIHMQLDPSTGVPMQTSPGEAFRFNVGVGAGLTLFSVREAGATNVVEIDPKSLAVTCERVKKAVLTELGMNDQWRGTVHLFVAPPSRKRQPVEILPSKYGDGWHYKMALPSQCDWVQLVRGLVEVVLLELSNRNAQGQLVQPPLWLTEGLSGLIVAEQGRTLVAEANSFLIVAQRKAERLNLARQVFRDEGPATFNELSWPDATKLSNPDAWLRYQAAAQLFTQELLNEPDGRPRLQAFLRGLPQTLNWQTTFLRAFNPRFITLLDVERWWSVAIADFQSRDPSLQWTQERVLSQLNTIILENAEIRTGTNGPVSREEIPLSQLVSNWDYADQREVLSRKANQLQLLHVHAPPGMRPLIAEYFLTLDAYVRDRQRNGGGRDNRGDLGIRSRVLIRETARKLSELEARIQALQKRG